MEHSGVSAIVREGWGVVRRGRALWWLGMITTAQSALFALVFGALLVPLVALPRAIAVVYEQSGTMQGAEDLAQLAREDAVLRGTEWFYANWVTIAVVFACVFVIWIALGVLDVAAQAGLVTQADRALDGRDVSAVGGLRDGFAVWWRAVGLLALSVMPSMLYALALAVVAYFTVSLPLLKGEAPNIATNMAWNAALSPLSLVTSLLAIPLAVLVQLGLRYAAIADRPVTAALHSAWDLLRRRLGDVALLFLALYGIALAVAIGMIAVVGVVVSVFAAAFAGTMAVSGPGGLPYAVAAVGVLAVLVVFAVVQTGLFVFNSASITAFWRREARELETGPDPSVAIEAGPSAHRGGEGETIAEVALERGQQH